jgi:polysaccharide deacetylase family protein (PEP-CTERM system associated)
MTGDPGPDGVILTVDVEEWFHVPGHPVGSDPGRWHELPGTLGETLPKTLDLLDRLGVKATFFFLGWAAARHPPMVRRVHEAGHEVACHGWGHDLVGGFGSPGAFGRDLRRAREAIEDASGAEVVSYRAPRWSMPDASWPYEVLRQEGFGFSSSRLAVPGLGWRRGPVGPFHREGVVEIPALRFARCPLPAGGTLALRILPLSLLRRTRDAAAASGRPAVFWFHPWELLVRGPMLEGSAFFRAQRYGRLEALPGRLASLVPAGDRTLKREGMRFLAPKEASEQMGTHGG